MMTSSLTRFARIGAFLCVLLSLGALAGCGSSSQSPLQSSSAEVFPTLSTSSFDFGAQFAGSSVTQAVVTVKNPASVGFTLGNIFAGDSSFTISPGS